MSTSSHHSNLDAYRSSFIQDHRNKALIANLWVILATIVISASLNILIGDEGVQEVMIGFAIYFVSNSLALYAAYRKYHRVALIGYTTQVFIVSTIAMVLINDIPAHLVLAMVNFVLLHAAVLGKGSALTVTTIMVALLLAADYGGQWALPITLAMVESGELVLSLSDKTTMISLLTTVISTSYLIVTTISLQEQARLETLHSNALLTIAQSEIQERMEKDKLLSILGSEAASARSIDALYESLRHVFDRGLTNYNHQLITAQKDQEDALSIGFGEHRMLLRTTPLLSSADQRFVQNAINLIEGAHSRILAEARNRKAERLEGVGKLAASVAHDFNNLLVPITAAFDLSPNSLSDIEHQNICQAASDSSRKASALVEKLLAHACSLETNITTIDFCEVIRTTEPLLRTFVDGNVQLSIHLPSEPALVKADTVELEQILLNTILNAREAIQDTGQITVSVTLLDNQVVLEVRDTGPGIPEAIQAWVLEPFHTTKPDGSGLGLATVDRIVKGYEGTLTFHSPPEGGLCLRIHLPRLHSANTPVPSPSIDTKHSFQIALIDDDPRVGLTIKMMLESLGHNVEYFTSGLQAQEHLQNAHSFDIIVTDYQMPTLTGIQLMRSIRSNNDPTPVIILSGYGAAIDSGEGIQPELILSKPIRIQALNLAVHEVMAAKR